MAKLGKLTKLKSAIKRWPSISKLGRSTSSASVSAAALDEPDQREGHLSRKDEDHLHAVYVGRSRRRYLVGSDVVQHPLFRELVDKSSAECDSDVNDQTGLVVSCEVVLFEHLLWMLENAGTQLGSAHELVQFYT